MFWSKTFVVGLEERGVLFLRGTPTRLLLPGSHQIPRGRDAEVQVFSTTTDPEKLPDALVPLFGDEVMVVDVGSDERGVLFERAVAVRRLAPGRHVLWTHQAPTVRTFAVSKELAPGELSPAVRALLAEDLVAFDVAEEERAILLQDNVAVRALAPGRHLYWLARNVAVVRYDARTTVAAVPPAHSALLRDELVVFEVARTQRAVVSKHKQPVSVLGAGQHSVWKRDDVQVAMLDVRGVRAEPLDANVRALFPAGDYTEVTVPDGSMGLRYVDGAFESALPPGRHAAFCVEHQVSFALVDLRERVVTVQGQEILTKDRVSLRLNASMTYRIADVERFTKSAKNAEEVLYLSVQLGLRESVALHTLDELLSERALLADGIKPAAAARATELGIELTEFGVKDVILPGEIKSLLNRVIEAQKTAEANVILRREETAAVRSMAQTAKLLGENPVLLRLKELESYREFAQKVGTLHVVLGADSVPKLELKP